MRRWLRLSFFTRTDGPFWWQAVRIGCGVRFLQNTAWSLMGSVALGTPWIETFYPVTLEQVVGAVVVAPITETILIVLILSMARAVRINASAAAWAVGIGAASAHPQTAPIMYAVWACAFFVYARVWQAHAEEDSYRATFLVAGAHAVDNVMWTLINTANVGLYGAGWCVFPHRCVVRALRLLTTGE